MSTVTNTLSVTEQFPKLDCTIYRVDAVGVAMGLLQAEQLKPVVGDHCTLPLLIADNCADSPGQIWEFEETVNDGGATANNVPQ
jgi:hypothetical protein